MTKALAKRSTFPSGEPASFLQTLLAARQFLDVAFDVDDAQWTEIQHRLDQEDFSTRPQRVDYSSHLAYSVPSQCALTANTFRNYLFTNQTFLLYRILIHSRIPIARVKDGKISDFQVFKACKQRGLQIFALLPNWRATPWLTAVASP